MSDGRGRIDKGEKSTARLVKLGEVASGESGDQYSAPPVGAQRIAGSSADRGSKGNARKSEDRCRRPVRQRAGVKTVQAERITPRVRRLSGDPAPTQPRNPNP